jgi:glyoxylase-like metal-dependent hydrolase (beta-lactamase superfamily II)
VIKTEHLGDVTRHTVTSWRSRSIGMSVSIFEVRGALVDLGFPAAAAEVGELIQTLRPRGVLVTHAHEDHSGNVAVAASAGVPVCIGESTLDLLSAEPHVELYRRFTWGTPRPLRVPLQRFEPDDLELVHAPGHSPDHHVVWDHRSGTLFSADLFLGVKVRVAHTYEQPAATVRSLRAMAARKPARMFDAHRGEVPNPVSALLAKAAWMEALIGGVAELSAEGFGVNDIASRLLGRTTALDFLSRGDYSKFNLVRAILAERSRDTERSVPPSGR